MKTFKAKSVILGRKKGDKPDVRPCFISLFNANNPHKTGEVPFHVLDFDEVHKIVIKQLDVSYLLPGNDIVINNLESVSVKVEGPHILVSGKQK